MNWEGTPNAFAFYYPYIVAFELSFIEIRHMITVRFYEVTNSKIKKQKTNGTSFT